MKILIVENEIYLAQSIASKLMEIGHLCEIATSIKDALKDEKYDAVLLSTNISGQNFYPVIEKHRSSIIILMISYISNDTVTNPIKAGACDYIQKPFMIEELIRKAAEKGVRVYGLSQYYIDPPDGLKPTIMLGYANISEDKMKEAVKLLEEAWK